MGYWGTFVLAKGVPAIEEVGSLVDVTDGALATEVCGPWVSTELAEEEVYSSADRVLDELDRHTQAPSLIGFILDSDCMWVAGSIGPRDRFRVCVAREATAGYLEDNDLDIDEIFMSAERATEVTKRWAEAAGCEPNPESLRHLFEIDDLPIGTDVDTWYHLLRSLGVFESEDA